MSTVAVIVAEPTVGVAGTLEHADKRKIDNHAQKRNDRFLMLHLRPDPQEKDIQFPRLTQMRIHCDRQHRHVHFYMFFEYLHSTWKLQTQPSRPLNWLMYSRSKLLYDFMRKAGK
jgi:hypothetical protein